MKKFGFTLAEALITLGIIGVVAAITIPNVAAGARNQANATKLASTVADLETAFHNMILEEKRADLTDTDYWNLNLVTQNGSADAIRPVIGRYIKIHNCFDNSADYYPNNTTVKGLGGTSDNNGTPIANLLPSLHPYCKLKSGAVLSWAGLNNDSTITQQLADTNGLQITSASKNILYIDVNGASGPNTVGRDIFQFYVANDGSLLPKGSRAAEILWNGRADIDNFLWTSQCPVNGQMGFSYSCTARLVENGYKVDY